MKTFSLKTKDVTRQWYLIDAAEAPLGRLATVVAGLLLGKHKTSKTQHIDGGDYVIVINSDKLMVSGKKTLDKLYSRHSGYPGGLRQKPLKDLLAQNSTAIIKHAVRGMMPDNKLRHSRLNRLKVYATDEHPHAGQNPEQLTLNESRGKKL
jgi:large subunit ribosomal protein L13